MKTRTSFVSNSSSTSFLVGYNSANAFDGIKNVKGYNVFMKDIKDKRNMTSDEVFKFLESHFENLMMDYDNYLHFKDTHWGEDPKGDCDLICKKMHCSGLALDRINFIVAKGMMITENFQDKSNKSYGYEAYCSELYRLSMEFAALVQSEAVHHWKHLSSIEYSDNDGSLNSYMEHTFMYESVLFQQDEDYSRYMVIDRNEH